MGAKVKTSRIGEAERGVCSVFVVVKVFIFFLASSCTFFFFGNWITTLQISIRYNCKNREYLIQNALIYQHSWLLSSQDRSGVWIMEETIHQGQLMTNKELKQERRVRGGFCTVRYHNICGSAMIILSTVIKLLKTC